MKLIFFGTPQFAVPSLNELIKSGLKPSLVVTQPDRPRGRSRKLKPSSVKKIALENSVKVIQPEIIDENFLKEIEAIQPDILVVVAYGKILPGWLLKIALKGAVNLHASLLPAYRGAAPIQRAILNGEEKTGITIMLLDEGMDTGPILAQQEVKILEDDTSGSLAIKLAEMGAILLVKTVSNWLKDQIEAREQDKVGISQAPKIEKEERIIDWTQPANKIRDKIRAFNPNPGAFTYLNDNILKVWKTQIINDDVDFNPGEILVEKQRLLIATGQGLLELEEIQPEGKKKMSGYDFLLGHQLKTGERFNSGSR